VTLPDYRKLARTLREIALLDHAWRADPAGHDDIKSTPWMPFEIHAFIALVAEALPELQGGKFLEVGCGIGTRMKVARDFFGLDVHGFDRVPEYVQQAKNLDLDAWEADALEYEGYGDYNVLWFNRPFRDQALQAQLEERVWGRMRSGAVVICANLNEKPPPEWFIVLDDWEVRRGIWQKP